MIEKYSEEHFNDIYTNEQESVKKILKSIIRQKIQKLYGIEMVKKQHMFYVCLFIK